MSLAPPSELNGVKVYNLASVGRALPAWVSSKKALLQKKAKRRKWTEGSEERIEVLQDLFFPTSSGRVKVSRDGGTLMATGGYPPQVRAYELRELSLKFSRHFEAEVVQFQMLSPDWKKAVFLLADRSVEFHSQFGKHHVTRIPTFGRAIGYQRETCELLLGGSGADVYRLSLERGSFLAPMRTGTSGVNAIAIHPSHGMLALGTQDGTVQCWDPRTRVPLGTTLPFDEPEIAHAANAASFGGGGEDELGLNAGARAAPQSTREVSALRFDSKGLTLAVGTSTGHVALYDIRRGQPMLVKDHQYGLPILDIKYHDGSSHLVSSDAKSIKIWDREHGRTYTTIQPPADVNDVALYPGSGMLFAALETERLGAYFLPSLGPAPRWCHFLDAMTEEMEEVNASVGLYDDYKFVTREDLEKLSLGSLVGTSALRPYMHGFFIDSRLHAKAVSLSQPFAYEQWRKERLQQKLAAKTSGRIAPVARPKVKVNAELADELRPRSKGRQGAEQEARAGDLLDDDRFANLFNDPDFQIDKESDAYQAAHPHALQAAAAKRRAREEGSEDEEENEGDEDDEEDEEEESEEEEEEDADGEEEGGEEEDELGQMRRERNDAAGTRKSIAPLADGAGSKRDRAGRAAASSNGRAEPRMIALRQDVLKGSSGGVGVVEALPASASFGDRLASIGGSAGSSGARGTPRAGGGNRELSFVPGKAAAEEEPSSGRGRGGKGKGGRGGSRGAKGAKGAARMNESISADNGEGARRDAVERRGLTRGMLGPSKGGRGKGKGKGGSKGRGGKGRGKGRGR